MDSNAITVIGIMSGSSLDGVDIACCRFNKTRETWNYKITNAETIEYPLEWQHRLKEIECADALTLARTNVEYGAYLGRLVKDFMSRFHTDARLVASHGHTIFHQPAVGLTLQIGHGAAIAAECGLPTVSDFRTMDVALGGQGAPLVPIGDRHLFGSYSHCLNLGGFCNISFEQDGERIAFDISPCNMVLNYFCQKLSLLYDDNGQLAGSGQVDETLLTRLNDLPYYNTPYPKSLGKEWVLAEFLPILEEFPLSIPDVLRTIIEHIAIQISNVIRLHPGSKLLVTGGGTYNGFLISRLKVLNNIHVVIPDSYTINYKEALIFAFLGVLRINGEINVLKSVTGAIRNNIGGAVYLP